jgi:putative tryptophan/tyrosine transport system substrate-binding protein
MDRRTFISAAAGSLIAPPFAAMAQQAAKIRRIGVLLSGTITSPGSLTDALRTYGWMEGQNLTVERRAAANKVELVPVLAAELVNTNVDVIVTYGAVASLAAKNATTTIPIVSATGDPVRLGLVPSLSRPGGNITGVTTFSPELSAKRLQLLRELVPALKRVGTFVNPANEYARLMRDDDEQNFRSLGMQPIFVEVTSSADRERSFATLSQLRAQALVLGSDPLFVSNRDRIAGLALAQTLPMMAEGRRFAVAGALASYAPSETEMFRSQAGIVDKILRGSKPGDIPIEQPSKFDLVINLNTAKALGITIPQSLLLRADEVIQ